MIFFGNPRRTIRPPSGKRSHGLSPSQRLLSPIAPCLLSDSTGSDRKVGRFPRGQGGNERVARQEPTGTAGVPPAPDDLARRVARRFQAPWHRHVSGAGEAPAVPVSREAHTPGSRPEHAPTQRSNPMKFVARLLPEALIFWRVRRFPARGWRICPSWLMGKSPRNQRVAHLISRSQ
jgi:hypothetical protein